MEDKAEDYDFDYYSLTKEMERAFSTIEVNVSKGSTKPSAIMSPICTTCISSSSTKSMKMKDNMNSRIGGLLLTSPLTSLADFKKEGLRVDRWLKKHCEKHAQHYKAFLIVQKFLHLINI